jgi:hypothetical protein
MITRTPPKSQVTLSQKQLDFMARRAMNARAWGVGGNSDTVMTKAEQAEADEKIVAQVPVVHRQVIEAAPVYDECLACQ